MQGFKRRRRGGLVAAVMGSSVWSAVVGAQAVSPAAQPAPAPAPVAAPKAVESLKAEAELLRPLVSSDMAKALLDAVALLPEVSPRVVHRHREKEVLAPKQFEALAEADRAGYTAKEYDARFYYYTGYGSPLVYVRAIDVAASRFGMRPLAGARVMDFGYGSIGQLRLMASCGAQVHGVEVEPVLKALYREPSDVGLVANPGAAAQPGTVTLHHGQWPTNPRIAAAVGGGYDLITSKNTLKRGYIHPEREADPKRLVHLGVSDEAFVKAVHDALEPGGLFVIYNISPALAPADKPYIPWADGRCPFERAVCEKAGLEILAWDEDDQAAILDWWKALGYDQGKPREEAAKDVFAHLTVMRRKA